MSAGHQDPDKDNTGFRSIGEIIAELKARVEQALVACDENAAAEAHEDLVDLEHQARLAATVRRYSRAAGGGE